MQKTRSHPTPSLLRGLQPEAEGILFQCGIVRRFAPGEILWAAGAEPRGLFVILEGRVRVVRAPQGRQYSIHTEGPGGTLGEVPLFTGGRYPATAVAAEPTVCLVIDQQSLGRAISADPELAFRLLGRLAERVRTLIGRMDRQAGQSVASRLAGFLLARREEVGSGPFTLGATQAEVAEELGTVREVLVRAIGALRKEGLIRTVGRARYEIPDAAALRRRAAQHRSTSD